MGCINKYIYGKIKKMTIENRPSSELTPAKKFEKTVTPIEAKDGRPFTVELYQVDSTIADVAEDATIAEILPKLTEIAVDSFPNWTDNGKYFAEKAVPTANAFSITTNEAGEIIGFNLYQKGVVKGNSFAYTKYAGVSNQTDSEGTPLYRRQGLMEKSRLADIDVIDPNILMGCSAVGEIHLGVDQVAKQSGRVVFPREEAVPEKIGLLGQEAYAIVNGADVKDSVDPKTLVRHGKSAYIRGQVIPPFMEKLQLTPNDAVIYMAVKPSVISVQTPS